MKLVRSLLVCLFAIPLLAQEHAPTAEQCRADQRLWIDQLDALPDEISRLSFRELNDRAGEMSACVSVDEERSERYKVLVSIYRFQQGTRLVDFVGRHNLMAQFLAEDKAGKR